MPDISSLLSILKSPKTALIVFLFSAGLLYFPFDKAGLARPSFASEYQAYIVVALFLSSSLILVETASFLVRMVQRPFRARKRQLAVQKVFMSLNYDELCVLWAMTQDGMKTIKGDYQNPIMISLRQKGCLNLIPGVQSLHEAHHAMPGDLFDLIAEHGFSRFPEGLRNSVRFEDEVQERVAAAVDWRRYRY